MLTSDGRTDRRIERGEERVIIQAWFAVVVSD